MTGFICMSMMMPPREGMLRAMLELLTAMAAVRRICTPLVADLFAACPLPSSSVNASQALYKLLDERYISYLCEGKAT
jgi:hypothetical protein